MNDSTHQYIYKEGHTGPRQTIDLEAPTEPFLDPPRGGPNTGRQHTSALDLKRGPRKGPAAEPNEGSVRVYTAIIFPSRPTNASYPLIKRAGVYIYVCVYTETRYSLGVKRPTDIRLYIRATGSHVVEEELYKI